MPISRVADPVLSLFRIVVGLLFTLRGVASVFGVLGGHRGSGHAVEFAVWPTWWAAMIQLVGGLLVLVGLWSRVAAIVCSGSMAYAYFVVHQPEALLPAQNGGELSALFCWAFFLVAILGPGSWALDTLLRQRRQGVPATELAPVA
ncbi:DoxX family protein [Micromonospora sp. WMMD882]|uniref:DoxX family protein n=1 Tax=Micromonospora sp. WMMD882 TaxID=3015151 RepID=UPI00248CD6D0|nr:DoxX family protein [Micromonospora sp. WMMD882]WBB79979.1 DoxX family protein [Micromonospora sp. WMMD882]